ncbi:MAG: sensor histidine kinase [Anaerolineales bacterium]
MIEPGLLRVFRGYAVLRLALVAPVLLLALPAPLAGRLIFVLGREILLIYGGTILLMILLVAYLFSSRLQSKLGRLYIPIALLAATAALILEQYFFTPRAVIWQADSFLFILLILVAWQYDFKAVLLFVFGSAALDYLLNRTVGPTVFFTSATVPQVSTSIGPANVVVFYGRQFVRSLSLLVVGFVITSLVSAQRQQRKELAAANQALVQHAETREQLATSRERNRLSRELHDTLAHTLSGLTVQLEALQTAWAKMPAQAAAMVEKMVAATRSGLDETRRTLKNLRASPLEELGLALAVQQLAEGAAARNNLQLELQVDKHIELPPEAEQSFYRVAQEALENVARHAQAKSVAVKLQRMDGGVELQVKDDGLGLASESAKGERLGLTLMKERAELIGAQFTLESEPRAGTLVRMVFPT